MQSIGRFLLKVKKILDRFVQCERIICSIILVILVALTFIQVVMRYVFNSPFSWSEELTLMFLVWFGYLCMAIDIYTDGHAALYFLYNKMPAKGKKACDILRQALLIWFFSMMIKYGLVITKLNLPKPQPATHLSQAWLFAPLVVGGILMFIYALFNLLCIIVKPISEYQKEIDKPKTVDDMNVERGGTV